MDSTSEKPLKLRLIGVRMSGFKERYEEFDSEGKRIKQQQVGLIISFVVLLMCESFLLLLRVFYLSIMFCKIRTDMFTLNILSELLNFI